MSKYQRDRNAQLDALLEVCEQRGISSAHLGDAVRKSCVGSLPDGLARDQLAKHADKVNAAGLSAQLSYLLSAWRTKKLTAELNKIGGVLDAIVRSTSSSREELMEDIGRDNINADGDVI
jgi:hypothetical protein